MTTTEEILKLGTPDPEFSALLEKIGPIPAPNWSSMEAVRQPGRARFAAAMELLGPNSPHCSESEIEIPRRTGDSKMRAKLFKPTAPAAGGSPLAVLFFGGGFVMGFPEQMTRYARDLAELYGVTTVAPGYRLGPEEPFPGAPHDAWDAVRWASSHAADLGADTGAGFILGGVSAGANLSLVVGSQWVEEDHQPPLTGLWLNVPFIFAKKEHVPAKHHSHYLAMEQNANTPILTVDTMIEMRTRYAPDMDSMLYSPGLRTAAIPKMPPVFFQVCGMDPLRDDALIYNSILQEAGRKTRLNMYPGHVHAGFHFFTTLSVAREAHLDFQNGLGWLLGKEPRGGANKELREGGTGA